MRKSGFLLVDKPANITSAAVLRKLSKAFPKTKFGHGGTLDPFATGLLVVLVEDATKIARFLLSGDKTYEAEATIGLSTETGDIEGDILLSSKVRPSISEWQNSRLRFLGEIEQKVPKYSAVKIKGKAAYHYARAGVEVETPVRKVHIHDLEILNSDENTLSFRVTCSGGTYIRSLAEDWAVATNTLAHLSGLRRLASGVFQIEQAMQLDDVLVSTSMPKLIPLSYGLQHLPSFVCSEKQAQSLVQGKQEVLKDIILNEQLDSKSQQDIFIYLKEDITIPVAIAKTNPSPGVLCRLERVLFDPS